MISWFTVQWKRYRRWWYIGITLSVWLSIYPSVRLSRILVNIAPPKSVNRFYSNFTDKTQASCRCALKKMMSLRLFVCPVRQLCYTDDWDLVDIIPPKSLNRFYSNFTDKAQTPYKCAWRKVMSVWLLVCLSCLSVVLYRWTEDWKLVNASPLRPLTWFHSNFTDNAQTPCKCAWR